MLQSPPTSFLNILSFPYDQRPFQRWLVVTTTIQSSKRFTKRFTKDFVDDSLDFVAAPRHHLATAPHPSLKHLVPGIVGSLLWKFQEMLMGQNPVPLVNIKIAGKWMFIHPNMVPLVLTHGQIYTFSLW